MSRCLLHVWLGSPLPDECRRVIRHNISLLKPEDTAILVSDDAAARVRGAKSISLSQVEKLAARLKLGATFSRYREQFVEGPRFPLAMAMSDVARITLAACTPGLVYCDCDTMLREIPPAQGTGPGACFLEMHGAGGRIDHSVFAVNGDTEFFVGVLRFMSTVQRIGRGKLWRVINKRAVGHTNTIPMSCIESNS